MSGKWRNKMKKRLKKKATIGKGNQRDKRKLGLCNKRWHDRILLLLSQMQTVSKYAHQNNTTTHLYLKSIKFQSRPPINPIFGMYTIQNRKSYQSGHVVTIVNTYTIVIENQDLYNPNWKTSKAIIKHNDIKKKNSAMKNLERKILRDERNQFKASRPHQWPYWPKRQGTPRSFPNTQRKNN